MPKRNELVARPKAPSGWTIKFGTTEAANGYEALCEQAEAATATAYDAITANPRSHTNPGKHHRLAGKLASRSFKEKDLEQWQYEVTSAGRIWYVIDDPNLTVWLVAASVGHPKKTE